MDEYNSIKHEYETARMQEHMQQQEAERQNMIRQQQRAAHEQKQLGEINEYVQANYGLNPNEAVEFINEYSNPESITMDNLVQLYRFKKGVAQGQPQGQPVQPQNAPINMDNTPSPTFQQTQRAQQVPAPMGVQSGLGNSDPNAGKPVGQSFMESLIGNHNKNEAF